MLYLPVESPFIENRAGTLIRQLTDSIYVIDDEPEIRKSLQFVLATADIASWPFASAADFLDNLPHLDPAPILIDVRLPSVDGLELMKILAARGIDWPVIVMTAHADIPTAVSAIKLGALDLLEKPIDFDLLIQLLQLAFAQLIENKQSQNLKRNAQLLFKMLSPREAEVIGALIGGLSNKAVAFRLSLSVRTIEMHRANAIVKLRVKSIAEVVKLAYRAEIKFDVYSDCIFTGSSLSAANASPSYARVG